VIGMRMKLWVGHAVLLVDESKELAAPRLHTACRR
jgi:hypothetical protein